MFQKIQGRRRAGVSALAAALALMAAGPPSLAGDLAGPEFGTGYTQTASISQSGRYNTAAVEQRDPGQFARLSQEGVGNRLDVWQGLGHGNVVTAHQQGQGNTARISQSGMWDYVSLDQRGGANLANISQFGDSRTARVEQFGHGNRADVVQGPASPNISLRQHGDGNVATLIQY
jgi:minor curlin subunit